MIALACLAPLAGCLTGQTQVASLAPSSGGVAALGDGLIGQSRDLDLSGAAKAKALEAEYQALQFTPAGQPVVWSAGGLTGEVVPTQPYRVGSQDCRGYSHSVSGGQRTVKEVGTACRTGEARWKPLA